MILLMETSTAWAPSEDVLMSWSPNLTTFGPPAWSKQCAAVRTVVWSRSVPPHCTCVSHNKPDCFVVFNNGIFLFRKFGSTKFYCSVLVVTVYRKSIAEGVFGAKHHSPWPISLSGLCAADNAVV